MTEKGEGERGLAEIVLAKEMNALKDFQAGLSWQDFDRAKDLILGCEGTVYVIGAGTSSALARRLAHLLTCSGAHAVYLDSAQARHGYSGILRAQDLIIAFSRGGETSEINQLVRLAAEQEVATIAILENLSSELGRLCELALHVPVAPENDAFGVIPLASTLVHAAAGDVLCAAVLEVRGYSEEEFALLHPGGAVGKRLTRRDQERT